MIAGKRGKCKVKYLYFNSAQGPRFRCSVDGFVHCNTLSRWLIVEEE